jgi:hypothetical protein
VLAAVVVPVLAGAMTATVTASGPASAATPPTTTIAPTGKATPQPWLVANPVAQSANTGGAVTAICRPILDPGPGGEPAPEPTDCIPGPLPPEPPTGCTPSLTKNVQPLPGDLDLDDPQWRIAYGGTIECAGPRQVTINGRTRLVERTPGRPDGQSIGEPGSSIDNAVKPVQQTVFVASAGFATVRNVDYPAAQQVEVLFDYSLRISGTTWAPCGTPPPGIRVVSCSGAGTDTITVSIGTNSFATGVVRPCDTYDHTLRVKSDTVPGGPLVDLAEVATHVRWCWNSQEVTEVTATGGTNWSNVRDKTTVAVSGPDGPGRAGLTDPVSGEPAGQFKVSVALAYEFVLGPITYKGTCTVTIDGWYYTVKGQHYFRDFDGCSDRNLQGPD